MNPLAPVTIVLLPIMLGAIATELMHGAYAKALIPATVLALLGVLCVATRGADRHA